MKWGLEDRQETRVKADDDDDCARFLKYFNGGRKSYFSGEQVKWTPANVSKRQRMNPFVPSNTSCLNKAAKKKIY